MRQINESEKAVYMGKGSVALDLGRDDARSILCQAMMDETIRLRECRRQKERDSIRKFLIKSFQTLNLSIPDTNDLGRNLRDKPR